MSEIIKKVPIEFDKAIYLEKCNAKECYMCGAYVAKYVKLICKCGDTINCPLCKFGKPANVPICDKKECIDKLQDEYINNSIGDI